MGPDLAQWCVGERGYGGCGLGACKPESAGCAMSTRPGAWRTIPENPKKGEIVGRSSLIAHNPHRLKKPPTPAVANNLPLIE